MRSQLERTDQAWSRTCLVDPSSPFWGYASTHREHTTHRERTTNPGQELLRLLAWGCKNKVITDDDRALLLCLAEAADRATTWVGRGAGGLMANEVSAAVAAQWGIGATTVRRRAHRAIDALASARTTRQRRVCPRSVSAGDPVSP